MCIIFTSSVLFYFVCIAVLHALDAGLLAISQYSEGPVTGHLDTGFSWFPCVYKQMLRWFPRLQFATICFSCSPPDLNFLDPYFIFMYMHNNHCQLATAYLLFIIIIIIIIIVIIIIIIIIISFIQGNYAHIRETNYVPREYSFAAVLLLLFMVFISLVPVMNVLYFYISTFRIMCAVPNMAVFCSSLTSYFPGMLLMYFLNVFEIVPVAPIITGITCVFTFHMRCISV